MEDLSQVDNGVDMRAMCSGERRTYGISMFRAQLQADIYYCMPRGTRRLCKEYLLRRRPAKSYQCRQFLLQMTGATENRDWPTRHFVWSSSSPGHKSRLDADCLTYDTASLEGKTRLQKVWTSQPLYERRAYWERCCDLGVRRQLDDSQCACRPNSRPQGGMVNG